jgi:predicted PurR-regulated permease PerM
MNTAWSKPTQYVVGVSLVLLGLVVLYLSRSVIPLLIVAALLAVIVRPVITWLHEGLRLPRGIAVAATYLGLAIIVPLAFVLVVPAVVKALQDVVGLDYAGLLVRGTAWLRQTWRRSKRRACQWTRWMPTRMSSSTPCSPRSRARPPSPRPSRRP